MRQMGLIFLFFTFMQAQRVYYWPLAEMVDWKCNSTFCEYRHNHFHEGIDIPTGTSWYTVWSATYAFKCIRIGYVNGGADGRYVTIQHYGDFGTPIDSSMKEGSRYFHLAQVNQILQEGGIYINTDIAYTNFVGAHLHFELREPAPLLNDDKNSFNPLYYYGIEDNNAPVLQYLYADGSTNQSNHHQGDAVINSWNFLKYSFMSYYDSTSVAPFIRLTLPAETPDNDLDDPHIVISGNRKVRFVLKAKDQVTTGYPNCAPYWIALYLNVLVQRKDDILAS